MSQISLLTPKEKLERANKKTKLLTNDEMEAFLDIMKFFKSGKVIYPGAIVANTGIDMRRVYALLMKLVLDNVLDINYEVVCNKCKEPLSKRYERKEDIPEFFYCNECDREIDTMDNTIVIFKVK